MFNSTNSQINFKISIVKSSLCDYDNVYILVQKILSAENTEVTGTDANVNHKEIVFKNYASFNNCMSERNIYTYR